MGERVLKASWLRQSTKVESVQGVHIPALLVESIIRFLSCLKMLKIKCCCLVQNGVQWKINYAALGLILVSLHTPFLYKSRLLPYKREMWGVLKFDMFWSLMQSSSRRVNRENSCSVKPLALCEENSIAPHCDMTTLDQAHIQKGLPQLPDDMKYIGTQSLWLSADVNHQNFSGFTIKLTWFQLRFVHLC